MLDIANVASSSNQFKRSSDREAADCQVLCTSQSQETIIVMPSPAYLPLLVLREQRGAALLRGSQVLECMRYTHIIDIYYLSRSHRRRFQRGLVLYKRMDMRASLHLAPFAYPRGCARVHTLTRHRPPTHPKLRVTAVGALNTQLRRQPERVIAPP